MSAAQDGHADVVVLCYHAVSDRWPAALSVSPRALRSQLESLVSRGYRSVTFGEAFAEGESLKRVALTFDDAFRSVVRDAFPILSDLGLVATLFVPTAFIGSAEPMRWSGIDRWVGGPHEHELIPLSWDEIETLAAAGWEIGSHSCTHPRLTTLSDAALADELGASRAACAERLGRPCRSLAYPYGDHDERVVRAAAAAGYEDACTLPHRPHPASPLRRPRVGIYHDDGTFSFRLKTSRIVQRLRATRDAT